MDISRIRDVLLAPIRQRRRLSRLLHSNTPYRALSGNRVELTEFGIILDMDQHGFFLRKSRTAKALKDDCGARFFVDSASQLIVELGGLHLQIRNEEELYILEEIFWHHLYQFALPTDDTMVVCDIGMNVGYAALYFASIPKVERVYGFEPIGPTYVQALRNIALNPAVASKIDTKNYGLGRVAASLFMHFDPTHPGQASARNCSLDAREGYQSVKIADCSKAINQVMREYPSRVIVLKVDCEGCEDEIFDALNESGALKRIQVCIIEWHDGSGQRLSEILGAAGFLVVSNRTDATIGMLYAYNPILQ